MAAAPRPAEARAGRARGPRARRSGRRGGGRHRRLRGNRRRTATGASCAAGAGGGGGGEVGAGATTPEGGAPCAAGAFPSPAGGGAGGAWPFPSGGGGSTGALPSICSIARCGSGAISTAAAVTAASRKIAEIAWPNGQPKRFIGLLPCLSVLSTRPVIGFPARIAAGGHAAGPAPQAAGGQRAQEGRRQPAPPVPAFGAGGAGAVAAGGARDAAFGTSVRRAPPVAVGDPAYRGSWNSRSSAVTSRPSVRTSFTVKPGNVLPRLHLPTVRPCAAPAHDQTLQARPRTRGPPAGRTGIAPPRNSCAGTRADLLPERLPVRPKERARHDGRRRRHRVARGLRVGRGNARLPDPRRRRHRVVLPAGRRQQRLPRLPSEEERQQGEGEGGEGRPSQSSPLPGVFSSRGAEESPATTIETATTSFRGTCPM